MGENLNNNPFAGLFADTGDNSSHEKDDTLTTAIPLVSDESEYKLNEDKLLQEVFGILRNDSKHSSNKQLFPVDSDTADSAIYLRISATNIVQELVPKKTDGIVCDQLTVEAQVIPYMFGCFCELQKYMNDLILQDVAVNLQKILIRYLQLVLEDNSCVDNQPV